MAFLPPDLRRETTALIGAIDPFDARVNGKPPGALVGSAMGQVVYPPGWKARFPTEVRDAWLQDLWAELRLVSIQGADSGGREITAEILTLAADAFDQADRKDLAEQARSLAAAFSSEDDAAILKSVVAGAQMAASEGRWPDVVARLTPLIGSHQGAPSRPMLEALVLLARAHRELGQPAEADAAAQQAQSALGALNLAPGERVTWLTAVASVTGDPSAKAGPLAEAEEAAAGAKLEVLRTGTAQQVAEAALELGDLAAARQALLGDDVDEESKREHLAYDPLLRQQWFADSLGPYRKLLKVAALQGDAALALDCGERMRSRALLDQLAWRKVDMGVKLDKPTQERLGALRETRRLAYGLLQRAMGGGSSVLSEDERGLYMPIRGPLDEAKPVTDDEVAQLKGLIEKLGAEEAALESAVRERVPAYAMAAQTRIPTADELATVLARDPNLAVLEYTLCDDGVVVVGVRGGSQAMVHLVGESPDSLLEHITSFRKRIWAQKDEAAEEAQWLYGELVTPMEGLLTGATRLWVVGHGAIQLIPFGALQDPAGRYLAERMAVAYAPSLSLPLMSRGERRKADLSALVVAAPETGAIEALADDNGRGMYMPIRGPYMPIRGPEGVSSALTGMATIPLPGAKAEGESVAARFPGATLLTGADATKQALIEQGSKCNVLHIATHGYADPEVPEFSGLLLAGTGEHDPYQVLTAQEVYLWDLQARLVTLSACQTGMGRSVEGEGLLGLTRAFIYAGAQDVVCSLWPVSDQSTQKLMQAFYTNLPTANSVEEALTQAQRALLADDATKHPFYWAAFVPVRGAQ